MLINNSNTPSGTLSSIMKENATKFKDFVNLAILSQVANGYSKNDAIVHIELSESLLVDEIYPIRKKSEITLSYFDTVIDFELFDIYEELEKTFIVIYGSREKLLYFFKSLEVGKDLSEYNLIITKVQQAQENPIKPVKNIKTYNITETSFTLEILDFVDTSEKFRIRYRKANIGDVWTFIDFNGILNISNLITDTLYEFRILRFSKYPTKFSNYSDLFYVKTF